MSKRILSAQVFIIPLIPAILITIISFYLCSSYIKNYDSFLYVYSPKSLELSYFLKIKTFYSEKTVQECKQINSYENSSTFNLIDKMAVSTIRDTNILFLKISYSDNKISEKCLNFVLNDIETFNRVTYYKLYDDSTKYKDILKNLPSLTLNPSQIDVFFEKLHPSKFDTLISPIYSSQKYINSTFLSFLAFVAVYFSFLYLCIYYPSLNIRTTIKEKF